MQTCLKRFEESPALALISFRAIFASFCDLYVDDPSVVEEILSNQNNFELLDCLLKFSNRETECQDANNFLDHV
jgi:hypothetical protein